MKTLALAASAGIMMLGTMGFAQAQVSGTPYSAFPNAAPHEIRIINGVPCRTVLEPSSGQRIPVQCATPTGMMGMAGPIGEPMATGSIAVAPGAPISGTPYSAFPNAAPHEIRIINGFACRTVLVPGTNERVPVECAR